MRSGSVGGGLALGSGINLLGAAGLDVRDADQGGSRASIAHSCWTAV